MAKVNTIMIQQGATYLPASLHEDDITFLKRKHHEIADYFQLKMLLASDDDFRKRAELWNWSLSEIEKRFGSVLADNP